MQAPPSTTASGEQLLSALPSSPFAARSSAASPPLPVLARTVPGAASAVPVDRRGVADGIGLAHDAGNLLGAIRLYCDLLALPGVLRSEHRHYAEELRHLSLRSGSLIDRMLQTGMAGEGHTRTSGSDAVQGAAGVQLTEVVAGCRGLIEKIAAGTPLLVSIEAGVSSAVPADREAVERILVNLTKNAAAAVKRTASAQPFDPIVVRLRSVSEPVSETGGRETGAPDGWVALSVEDCGGGMSPETVRALLAGRAACEQGADGETLGRGIGLRVVRELVERTSGQLRIYSRPGRGTKVEIVWPVLAERPTETG